MSKYNAFGNSRGNKLWEGSRMILPEHRAYMARKEIEQERFVELAEIVDVVVE